MLKFQKKYDRPSAILNLAASAVNYAINHCLLYANYFIHTEKANDKCPSFLGFLTYYKRKLVIGRESYAAQDKLSIFTKALGVIYDIM